MRRLKLALNLAIAMGAAALLSSCAGRPPRPAFPLGPRVPPPHAAWEYPGAEVGRMRFTLRPDGTVLFEGGFTEFKTATWNYDMAVEDLTMTIPARDPTTGERTLHFAVGSETAAIDFLGWNYFWAEATAKPLPTVRPDSLDAVPAVAK